MGMDSQRYRNWFGVVEAGIETGGWKPDAG